MNLTRSHIPDNFIFKEYCPLVFQNLRSRFGIQDELYQVCLEVKQQSAYITVSTFIIIESLHFGALRSAI